MLNETLVIVLFKSMDYFVWSADRVITEIGPLALRWYGLLFAASFIAGYVIERKLFFDAEREEQEVESLLTYVLIGTVVGARLGHVLFYDPWFYFVERPDQILAIWNGGLASHGGAVGILIAMYLYTKKREDMSFYWLADRVVVPVALAGAFIRTGNFFNSEIYGKVTDVPWAVIFAKIDMLPRHPTMLYEAILSLLVFALLITIYKVYNTSPPKGMLFGTFLTTLFLGRFLLEYTKVAQADFAASWVFNMGQWLSLPLIMWGVRLLWRSFRPRNL